MTGAQCFRWLRRLWDEVAEMGNGQSVAVNDLPDGGTRMCDIPWPRKSLNYVGKKLKENQSSWSSSGARESDMK